MALFKHFSKKAIVYLLLSIVFLIASVFSGYYFNQPVNSDKILNKLQNIIKSKDEKVNFTIDRICSVLGTNPDSCFQILSDLENTYDSDGQLYFFYKNDSLIYWSNITAPFSNLTFDTINPVLNSGNAWYRKLYKNIGSYHVSGLYLIKNEFSYQNEYLINSFQKSFSIPDQATLSIVPSTNNVFAENGQFLFSLNFLFSTTINEVQSFTLLLLYLLSFIFFFGFVFEINVTYFLASKNKNRFILGFTAILVIFRIITFYFKIPSDLYSSNLFGPEFYASSNILPSIGDFFINSVFLLLIVIFLFNFLKINLNLKQWNSFYRSVLIILVFSILIIIFDALNIAFESLIIDSSISMDLNNIFSIYIISVFKFLIIAVLLLNNFLITYKLSHLASGLSKNTLNIFLLLLFVVFIRLLISTFYEKPDLLYLCIIFFYPLAFLIIFHFNKRHFTITNVVLYLIIFSLYSTYTLHKNIGFKEQEYRKLLAVNLAAEQKDLLAEYLIKDLSEKILKDSIIHLKFKDYDSNKFDDQELKNYIYGEYFSGYWKKYNQQITFCDDKDFLLIQPDNISTQCKVFFENMITNEGHPTENINMYFINYPSGDNGYLLVFSYSLQNADDPFQVNIYVELTPKYVTKELGFPDLLVNKNIKKSPDLTNYSYAKYKNGKLFKRVGKYYYNISLSKYGSFAQPFSFFDQNGYNHYFYKIDSQNDIILSIKQKSFLDVLAPFSYLFIFYGFITLLIAIIIFFLSKYSINFNFRTRLQISMASVILVSFLVVGVFSLYYIINLNDQKNKDIISEKTHSVLVELQQKLSDEISLNADISSHVNDLLAKFSSVFFTDINLFDLQGNLYSTSRPEIYDEFLISRKMNPTAYRALSINKMSLYIQTEHIGKQNYLSAYIPFVNSQNTIIAYLNLPYFAKQNDLKREISTFLIAYINIYVILISLSILIALIISNYVARPIKLIMGKIGKINLGGKNERIVWTRKDEIGQLVFEYNRMIDELALSADLLAKSERENAWREMARQVAHEIKNPLTPMKLSVQYLQKAYNENAPDWEKRLDKFTHTMIEQIETLSTIATEFSDFAKMPDFNRKAVDISEIIENAISLFRNYTQIQISLNSSGNTPYLVLGDKEQLLRAFNNLLKNAVQAIDEFPGKIEISIKTQDNNFIIDIFDTGKGIPVELSEKIFSPNFTTKSGGMGLGLAIVKNIIVSSGGEITFTSEQGKGTTFKILLPQIPKNNNY